MNLRSILINEEVHRKLKILSAEKNKKIKELVSEALTDLFKKYKER